MEVGSSAVAFPKSSSYEVEVGATSVPWGLAADRKLRKLDTLLHLNITLARCRRLAASIQAGRVFASVRCVDVLYIRYCNPHASHLSLLDVHHKSFRGTSRSFASCVAAVYAAVHPFVLSFVARTKQRSFIVHTSSLFGDFSSTKSVTPWLPTFPYFSGPLMMENRPMRLVAIHRLAQFGADTKAIKLKFTLPPSLAIIPRITSRHLSDKTSSSTDIVPRSIGLLRSPSI
jgi:hypothetical protein